MKDARRRAYLEAHPEVEKQNRDKWDRLWGRLGKENPANRETEADAEPDVVIHIHLQRIVDSDQAVARCGATLEAAKARSE